jgi:hypothetical protein
MDIGTLETSDVLLPDAVDEYNEGMDTFWRELVCLSVDIYIVEKIAQFPFDLLVPPGQTLFFTRVVDALLADAILIMNRLVLDRHADFNTLSRFKNKVLEWVKPHHRQAFRQRLRKVKFRPETEGIRRRARELRQGRIAHLKARPDCTVFPDGLRIELLEIKALCDEITKLFSALCFNRAYSMLPIQYIQDARDPSATERRPDIENLLDCVARSSHVLNMPELQQEYWLHYREQLSPAAIKILNRYRSKFGLSEA